MNKFMNKQALQKAATICPVLCKLTFDLLTLKVVSKSRVTWATSVQKVKCQLAGGGGILWRPPTQLVKFKTAKIMNGNITSAAR